VIHDQDGEHDHRDEQQIAGDAGAPHEQDSRSCADYGGQSAPCCARVENVEPLNRRAAIGDPPRVLFGGSVVRVRNLSRQDRPRGNSSPSARYAGGT
jgi:hypothetical protein